MSNSKKNYEKKNKKNFDVIRPDTKLLDSVTDRYFLRTREIVSKFGDTEVTYAIFMRRPVLSAICPAMDWLQEIIKERKGSVTINRLFNEGEYVGAGEPLVYISGSMSNLVDLERSEKEGLNKSLLSRLFLSFSVARFLKYLYANVTDTLLIVLLLL